MNAYSPDPCQVCGAEVTGYEMNRDVRPDYREEEMWPGGPLWVNPDPVQANGWVVLATHLMLTPCGHEQPDPSTYRWRERAPT